MPGDVAAAADKTGTFMESGEPAPAADLRAPEQEAFTTAPSPPPTKDFALVGDTH